MKNRGNIDERSKRGNAELTSNGSKEEFIPTMNQAAFSIKAKLVDVVGREIFPVKLAIENGIIVGRERISGSPDSYILPGFVDSHVHIESSMVSPTEFSRAAIPHGTVGTVSDPHEIANVLGMDGVKYMIDNAQNTPLKILFGAPSCVPATAYESSGAVISSSDISEMLNWEGIGYLSEMMNYPGVIFKDKEVIGKLEAARKISYPIDGHAPGVKGEDLKKYVEGGISTDHECFTIEEAREKISHGMNIQIREGSGAKNFDNLVPLLNESPEKVMFCSDDLHPDDLLKGHINLLVRRAVDKGYDLFDVLRAAGFNAIEHYNLDIGLLRVGDPADFIIVDSLKDWNISKVCINGSFCFEQGEVKLGKVTANTPNNFVAEEITEEALIVKPEGNCIKLIQAIDGELITKKGNSKINQDVENVVSDIEKDILKLTVVNRYEKGMSAVAFIKGFGLHKGAIASSIGHDSHNIICAGASDREIKEAINWIIRNKGGIVAYDGENFTGLPLPVAGIMTNQTVAVAAEMYKKASALTYSMGSKLAAPFMTLAFMSLLVIPELKLSDKGLFDGNTFSFTSLFDNI
jgi:adenine deaminase